MNPSVGLGLVAPLVPASDRKGCLATLATIQLGAGALLLWKPGRNPPLHRSVFRNRLIKLGGILVGSGLILMSGGEYTRLSLPYDPWREDAIAARKSYIERTRLNYTEKLSIFSPKSWWFYWYGPPDYHPVPWDEWQKRTREFLNKSGAIRQEFEGINKIHKTLVVANREAAAHIVDLIRRNELPAPEIPVEELEALAALPDMGLGEGDELFREVDLHNSDMWNFFQRADPFCFVAIPRSTPAFMPGVEVDTENLGPQLVNYLPIPQTVKTALR